MEVEQTLRYRCIHCGAPILANDSSHVRCGQCSCIYPTVAGIPILTHRPYALLRSYVDALRAADSRILELESVKTSAAAANTNQAHYDERMQRAKVGMRKNLSLIQHYMRPIEVHLQTGLAECGFIDAISSCGAGWPGDVMLANFFVDWGGTESFSRVKSLIVRGLVDHRADAEAVAILGAGACGLAHALGTHFDCTYGIDLSIPTLLAAQGVLAGDSVVVHCSAAGWHPIPLRGEQLHHMNIHLAVADVVRLPFEPNSLSAVVTQYLMDVVGNPPCVANEIRRVLKPGGVWVNFSLPLRKPTQPPEFGLSTLEEIPVFLKEAGLQLAEARLENHAFVDFQRIDKNALVCMDRVHFFVAQKPVSGRSAPADPADTGIHQHPERIWWNNAPSFAEGCAARIIRGMRYSAAGCCLSSELSFGSSPFPFLDRFPIDENNAGFLGVILGLVDGKRVTWEIHDRLTRQGFEISPDDLCEVFHYLSDRHGILRMDPPPVVSQGSPRQSNH